MVPDILYTDKGTNYVSKEFQKFIKIWNITHLTSSPRYPQSNGVTERHVQTLKKLVIKTIDDNKDLHLALLKYRNAPKDNKTKSASELLFGRKIKGQLHYNKKILKPDYKIDNHFII